MHFSLFFPTIKLLLFSEKVKQKMKVLVSIAAMLPWFKASANACDERQRVDFGKKPFVRFSIVLDDHSTSRDFVARSVASGPMKLVPLA